MTEDEQERLLVAFKESAGPGEPFWRILARDARAALDRGDLDLAERLTAKAEQMKGLLGGVAGGQAR